MPTVVPTDSRPLSWPPIGALPRNRLASSATGGASPISPPAGDRKGRPYGGLQVVQDAGRCGERTERCRWQRKRSERVAAVKILSVRRKAAQKFWAPQQGHRPLRKRILRCVGEGLCPQPAPMAKFSTPFHLYTGLYFPPISPTPPGKHPEKFMRLSDFPRSDIFSSCRENFFVLCSV